MANKWLKNLATWLVIIGAIVWGLVGAFGFNLITSLLGTGTLTDIVYIAVGLSGVWMLWQKLI